jgi:hypothetical protein
MDEPAALFGAHHGAEVVGDAILRDPLELFGLANLPGVIGIVPLEWHPQTPSTD